MTSCRSTMQRLIGFDIADASRMALLSLTNTIIAGTRRMAHLSLSIASAETCRMAHLSLVKANTRAQGGMALLTLGQRNRSPSF